MHRCCWCMECTLRYFAIDREILSPYGSQHTAHRSSVAQSQRGKRGGARTLVATNKGNRWFFVFGFEKNARANISNEEKEALQELAQDLLARGTKELDSAVEDGSLEEICHDRKD